MIAFPYQKKKGLSKKLLEWIALKVEVQCTLANPSICALTSMTIVNLSKVHLH